MTTELSLRSATLFLYNYLLVCRYKRHCAIPSFEEPAIRDFVIPCVMRLETIAVKILLNSKKCATESTAIGLLKSEFKKHFPFRIYDEWNRDIPDAKGLEIIELIGNNPNVLPKYLSNDLAIAYNRHFADKNTEQEK